MTERCRVCGQMLTATGAGVIPCATLDGRHWPQLPLVAVVGGELRWTSSDSLAVPSPQKDNT